MRTLLKLPGDDFVTIELVHDPATGAIDLGTGFSHLVVRVERMDDAVARLAAAGIVAEDPVSPDGSADVRTSWITDPDGRRIELVQWPAGHPDGLSASDWAD
jgi:lactoylglutathione lyase